MTTREQREEIACRVQAARDLLNGVLTRKMSIGDVGGAAISLIGRAMAIADGDWESFLPRKEIHDG